MKEARGGANNNAVEGTDSQREGDASQQQLVAQLQTQLAERDKELQRERGAKAVLHKRLAVTEAQLAEKQAALMAAEAELARERRKRQELLQAAEQQLASLQRQLRLYEPATPPREGDILPPPPPPSAVGMTTVHDSAVAVPAAARSTRACSSRVRKVDQD